MDTKENTVEDDGVLFVLSCTFVQAGWFLVYRQRAVE